MAILLLGGTISPALSQNSLDSNSIVINEVEINPLNGAEYVELYNPTSQSIDISGWSLIPSATWKKYVIAPNTIIEPQKFLSFSHHNSWFINFGDVISLANSSDKLIDKTPLLIDNVGDAKSWQRSTDGLDTNSVSDWESKTMTPNSSNGKFIETNETIFSFTGKTDKTNYTFDDTLKISGSVSESLFKDNSSYTPEIIKVQIQGDNYLEILTVYPDRDLNFSTTTNIKKTLGFALGTYDVKISYGDNSIQTEFVIIDNLATLSNENESASLEILTDKKSYIPGETVIISANTNSSLEYAGLDYIVLDPSGKQIFDGTIFQNSQFSIVHKSGGGQIYPFSTQILLQGVNPVYGEYEVQGIFKSQDPLNSNSDDNITANTTFQLIEDVKEDSYFSLSIDKEVYSVGDTITVTGRSNQIWTENIALQVQQTGVLSRAADSHKDQYIRPDPFSLNQNIYLNGDGTFEFKFKLVNNSNSGEDLSRFFGDYKLTVSEYFGNASVNFKVVDDPESFVDVRTPLGLQMDDSQYVLGTAISITGKILDYEHKASNNSYNSVKFTFIDPEGNPMMSEDRRTTSGFQYEATAPNKKLTLTAIPDAIGNFQISAILTPIQFDIGKYSVVVIHSISKISETIEFEIVTAQSEILPSDEVQEPLTFEICSSTRNDISEIIKDLKQIGNGEIPPSMESVDCDGTSDFVTGEKLVIRGKVNFNNPTYLDNSSVTTSGQTQTGSSYTTNYVTAQNNYVELSIPYPQTLIVSSSYQTIPDSDEDYHGGGGSGGGGVTSGDGTSGIGSGTGGTDNRETSSDRSTGYNGQVVYKEIKKNLIDMKVKAYPDSEGNFNAVFDLRAGIFIDGIYKIKANYFGYNDEQNFSLVDNSLKGGLKAELVVDTDKTEYLPGETVSISGKIKNVYYYDSVSLKIETPSISNINCLVGQQCGFGNSEKKIRVSEGTEGAVFFMNFIIPQTTNSVGKYNVIADTHFGQVKATFFVVSESDIVDSVSSTLSESPLKLSKIIEKFNRITDDKISIILSEKLSDDLILAPRVIQGSLFTSARGEESDVNLRVSTNDGQCIIGSNSNCLVSESTRKPGEIYSIVTIEDTNYKIRYSGNDVRLEKFSIIPENLSTKIDIDNWNVEIIKNDQPSRFYYKVSYVELQ